MLSKLGLSAGAVATAVQNQRAFDGLTSTITAANAGLVPHFDSRAKLPASDLFAPNAQGQYPAAVQAGFASREDTGASQRDVYYGSTFDCVTVLHETLHSFTGLDEDALSEKVGGNISTELTNAGCT